MKVFLLDKSVPGHFLNRAFTGLSEKPLLMNFLLTVSIAISLLERVTPWVHTCTTSISLDELGSGTSLCWRYVWSHCLKHHRKTGWRANLRYSAGFWKTIIGGLRHRTDSTCTYPAILASCLIFSTLSILLDSSTSMTTRDSSTNRVSLSITINTLRDCCSIFIKFLHQFDVCIPHSNYQKFIHPSV